MDKDSIKTIESPSGKYILEISRYKTREGCWSYTRGRVFDADGNLIEDVKRNYSRFPYAWAENHPNGHDYLICGYNYQGQTFVDLDTGIRKDFLSEGAKNGRGFCWADIYPSPDCKILAVNGCVWACPYEIILFDFSDPLNGVTRIDKQIPEYAYNEECSGWKDNDTLIIKYEVEIRKSDGELIDNLSEEEEAAAWNNDDYDEVERTEEFNIRES